MKLGLLFLLVAGCAAPSGDDISLSDMLHPETRSWVAEYADEGCTVQVIPLPNSDATQAEVRLPDGSRYVVGAEVQLTHMHYNNVSGDCVQHALDPDCTYHYLGAKQ